eukprot:5240398-Pyramimonas_sp.AAC.1
MTAPATNTSSLASATNSSHCSQLMFVASAAVLRLLRLRACARHRHPQRRPSCAAWLRLRALILPDERPRPACRII